MRIISGRFRSRKLLTPKDALTTRPIPDRVKESVFSMLRGNCEGAQVIDCFAGTGAIGLEALSLGAERVVFVERDRKAADMLRKNVESLEVEDETEVVEADALGPAALARCPKPVDLVFFDPPYPLMLDPERCSHVLRAFGRFVDLLSDSGFAILRTPWPLRHIRVYDQNGLEIPFGDERNPFDVFGRLRKDRPPPSGKRHQGERRRLYSEGERRRREDREDRGEKSWELDDIDLDAIQADTDEQEMLDAIAELGPARGLKIIREPVDLHLPNAKGPETHEYASMAVHFYMRKKA
jgi:16S rRNA (guanine(966)-N(2))-methyltransferase RsmD